MSSQDKKTGNILIFIFLVVWTCIGGVLTYFGIKEFKLYRASQNWPTTQGTIISSKVDHRENTTTDGKISHTYIAQLRYSYTVYGIDYTSDTYSFGYHGSSSPEEANILVSWYSSGELVTVHFDPNDPEIAVLNIQLRFTTILLILAGTLLIILGLLGIRKVFPYLHS